MRSSEEAQVISAITDAFTPRARPSDDDLIIFAKPSDTSLGMDETSAGRKFWGKTWQELAAGPIVRGVSDNLMLTPVGAAYFCPAVLVGSLRPVSGPSGSYPTVFEFHERFLFPLVPDAPRSRVPHPYDDETVLKVTRTLFTLAESRAIALYLRFLTTLPADPRHFPIDDIQRALQDYWGQFELPKV